MAKVRIILWALVAVVALAATGLYAYTTTRPTQTTTLGEGDYDLVTADGQPFTRENFNGHPTALFFGFTHCPDVCPTTLADIANWYEKLGPEAKDLQAVFITVDPERDTPQIMGDYVSWTNHVTGVTGSRAEIDKALKAWGVFTEKVPLEDGDYTMNHTASVFLINRQGGFEGTIAFREDTDTALAKLKKLING
ncbi:SCO family protein [Devosia sp. PTR5]|uniref:SCO family protein n=1 Tax=Devosia oryzisoli TaxID=2774138 RepID=A0A927ITW4_9HYPH|nr:SCO family protein [Devosia oryzisoli]MBD8066243.1 SCO family protein [Devosia oryzisoli]